MKNKIKNKKHILVALLLGVFIGGILGAAQGFASAKGPIKTKRPPASSSKSKKIPQEALRILPTISEPYTVSIIKVNGARLPKELAKLYQGITLEKTIEDFTKDLNSLAKNGTPLTNTEAEKILRDLFSQATTDTGNFANETLEKYKLNNIIDIAISDPKSLRNLDKVVKKEIETYAKNELNKLGNQLITSFLPFNAGLNIDFTDLKNEKKLKAALREGIVNSLAQSFLGPQYVVFYIAFETFFPHEAEKVHKELRRFDKKYIKPATDQVEDEVDRFVERTKAETKRTGERIEKEGKRFEKRVKNEAKRAEKKLRRLRKKL